MLSMTGSVLRIIILHKLVVVGVRLSEKGKQCGAQDVGVEVGLHNALENTYISGASATDPSPHMYFQRMFRSGDQSAIRIIYTQ